MKPNILIFFTDQQRWDTLGVNGNPSGLTPNLDRIARANTNIPLGFTCQPVCGPARACLQTGQYASTNGCHANTIPLSPESHNLGKLFNGAGYSTAYIGKWHLGDSGSAGPVASEYRQGYDYWRGANTIEAVSDHYRAVLYDNDGNECLLPGYRVDALTDVAIRYIATPRDTPFFLTVSYLEPHHQNHRDDHPAPEGYASLFQDVWMPPDLCALPGFNPPHLNGGTAYRDWPGYCGMIKRLDEALGRIEDCLRSTDQLDNTIIVFLSDHGSHFKTRNPEYKRSCHDASIHIPMVFAGPGFRAGGNLDELVSLVDVAPTLLDAAEIAVPPGVQGRSILPLLRRSHDSWPDYAYFEISEAAVGRGIRTKRWKYCVIARELAGRAIPDADTAYTEEFLYDLYSDPYELENIINSAAHEPVKQKLRAMLTEQMIAIGQPPPKIIPADTIKVGQRRLSELDLRRI